MDELISETLRYIDENYSPEEMILLSAPPPPPQKKPSSAPKIDLDSTLSELTPDLVADEKCPPPPPKKKPSSAPVADLGSTLSELAPGLVAKAPLPDDTHAKQIASGWKGRHLVAEVTLISLHPNSPDHHFLKNLCSAITTHLRPAKVILAPILEHEKQWELIFSSLGLKHLISFPIPFVHFPILRSYFRENTATKSPFFQNIPLTFLRPFADYQKDPLLKKELWSTLCQLLGTHKSS